jgi:surface antigen
MRTTSVRTTILAVPTRRLVAVAVATLVAGFGALLPARAAHATVGTNDYPYATSAVDQVDPWNFLTRECTSFVAWRLNHDAGVAFTNSYGGTTWGNAGNWANAARTVGVSVNTTPSVGSVAQFPAGVDGAGSLGHVAWVLSVGSGTVTVEDYNYADAYDGYTSYNYSQHTVNTAGLNFIHFTSGGGGYVTGTVEASPSLNVRSGPGTGYSVVGTVAYLSRVNISCYNTGTTVTATWPNGTTWTTAVWDGLRDNSTGRFNGTYVSDAWIDTGGDTSKMVPHC